VFLAERDDEQFKKTVAIKIVRSALLLMPEMLARFRSERQILASLDHPNIARLLDGGAAPNGSPYVVMEYIDGSTLGEYCSHHNLSLTDRLHLFRKICSAVHYAHQNLIVHRDIKPDNVIVTREGEPKLLDFGIAKLIDPAAASNQTQTRNRLMTPDYASPEQVRGEAITTATDVYALGVLLFELLSGDLPYKLTTHDDLELAQAICTEEPRRPSTLRPELSGDLENIILKALRKEPARRYASAEQFAEDIRRHLEGYPVIAQADRWTYRASKFVRRNTAAVAAAALAALLIVGFSISTTIQAKRIAAERDTAALEREKSQQVASFLTDLFRLADPTRTKGGMITAREILDSGAKRIEGELSRQPEIQATMMNEIGLVYRSIGLYDPAKVILEKGLAIRRRVLGSQHTEVAASLLNVALVQRDLGDYDSALKNSQQALSMRRQLLGNQSLDLVPCLNSVAILLEDKADYPQAEKLHREAVAILRSRQVPDPRSLATSLNNLAGVLRRTCANAEALPMMNEALELRRSALGPEHPETTQALNNLGTYYLDQADFDRAEKAFREVLAARVKVLGPDHPDVAKAMTNLASPLVQKKQYDEAISLLNQASEIFRKRLGPNHLNVAFVLDNLANLHYTKGDYKQADVLYTQSTNMFRARFGDDHPETAMGEYSLAGNFLAWKKYAEAEQHARKAERIFRIKAGPESAERLKALIRIAGIMEDKGDRAAAETQYREALEAGRKTWTADDPDRAATLAGLGSCLAARALYADAEPLLLESYPVLLKQQGKDSPNVNLVRDRIVTLFKASGQSARAKTFLQEAH
ncbi:MAG: serine/threonine-protein kinase, partial [Acidobacteriota bacterium]